MNKKNFIYITLCLSGLISTTHAAVPQIKPSLVGSLIYKIQMPIHLKPFRLITEAVKLISGEEAYLSGVSFENAGRNFWAGYVNPPKLKQARILKEFGGQSNSFKVHSTFIKANRFN
jgi:hypothetical protein